jgi:hypothetical protein
LELAFDFNVGDNYRQHLLVNIDSRWVENHVACAGLGCCGFGGSIR